MKQKHATLLLAAIVCFFLLQRGGLILYGYSHISHPGIDEPVSGVLPCDIIDGQLRAPLFAYEYLNRSGDVLIEGLLLVPYFKLFGSSIFSTKLFALTSALITFLCWFMFIKKYHGMLTAVLFGLLFALPPPLFARQNLIGTISSHHMLNPLIILQSLLLFKMLETGKERAVPPWMLVAFGLLAGLGVYTFYTYILFLGFCGIVLLLFFPRLMHPRNSILMGVGFAVGFLPWVLRAVSTRVGGQFLGSILKNISIDWWGFVQNFGFVIPHSFGYSYPSRAPGLIAVAFALFLLVCAAIISGHCLRAFYSGNCSWQKRIALFPPSCMQGLFCALFPVFFFTCLSLSPMRITPFEYWPTIGLFATFGPSDAIRYRWLHILPPFYFATIAIGMGFLLNNVPKIRVNRLLLIIPFIFFIFCNLWKSYSLYSAQDAGKIFFYKGYNYDQFASKFLLGDFASGDIQKSLSVTENYPEEHRGEAYKSFGTLLAEKTIQGTISTQQLDETLKKIPPHYLKDCIYGIIRTAHSSVPKFQAIQNYLIQNYPVMFYESWGSCYLGYNYYGALVNQQTLFDNIPTTEQWFYKNFLDKFKQETADVHTSQNALLAEIANVPLSYQNAVVRGLGMRVGSEMLFDTLCVPDYPLDSNLGENFKESLKEAFYEGVGSGFAETLCRFWRMMLLPESIDSPFYEKLLDIEWSRCQHLMSKLSETYYPIIKKGFLKSLSERHVPPGIKQYINKKFIL
jgi:hypothetical protein